MVAALVALDKGSHALPTLIIATAATRGEWREQLEAIAPCINVDEDLIIDTATRYWDHDTKFHRIILDESHLLGTNSIRKSIVSTLRAKRKWCFSTTPLHDKFDKQLEFLGLTEKKQKISDIVFFFKYMLRQTKTMMLSDNSSVEELKEEDFRLEEISMTAWERERYDHMLKTVEPYKNDCKKTKIKYLEAHWYYPLLHSISSSYGESSKIVQLQLHMESVRNQAGTARTKVVIFTLFHEQQQMITMVLSKNAELSVFSIDERTSLLKTNEIIQKFEHDNTATTAQSALVMTINSESTGLAVPGVQMVFLMEPCLDPYHEQQLVSRIGKGAVTHYYFEKTCESQVMDLHKAIEESLDEQPEEEEINIHESYIQGDTLLEAALDVLDVGSTWTYHRNRCIGHLCRHFAEKDCSNRMCGQCCQQTGCEPCSRHGVCQSEGCMATCSGPECPNDKLCSRCCEGSGEKHCELHRKEFCCGCNSAKRDKECLNNKMCSRCCKNGGKEHCMVHRAEYCYQCNIAKKDAGCANMPNKLCQGCCTYKTCIKHKRICPGCFRTAASECSNQRCGTCCHDGPLPCKRHKKT